MAERKVNTAEIQPGGVELTSFWNEKLYGNVVTGVNTINLSSCVKSVTDHQCVLEVDNICGDMENNLLILKYGSKEESFNFEFHPHSNQAIWNEWVEISFTASDYNPCILCCFLNEESSVQQMATNTTAKALVLINSSDSYHVTEDVFRMEEADKTVIVLRKTDGLKLSTIVQDHSSPVLARIINNNSALFDQAFLDHFQMTDDSPAMDASSGKVRQKKSRGPKDDLIAKIQEFLFPCNAAKPILHQGLAFIFLIGHFKIYKKAIGGKKPKQSDINEIVSKLKQHLEKCYKEDFLFYAVIIETMKIMYEGLAPLLLAKVESLQVKDFKTSVKELISWRTEVDDKTSCDLLFSDIQRACVFLKTQVASIKYDPQEDKRSNVYLMLIWNSLAVRFDERTCCSKKHHSWSDLFCNYQQEIKLDCKSSADISCCLHLGKEIGITTRHLCDSEDLLCIFGSKKKQYRSFKELRNFLYLLKKDFCLSTENISKVMVCIREDFDKVSKSADFSTQSFKQQRSKFFEEGIEFLEALFNFLINENDSADLTNEQHEVLRWTNFTIQKVNIDFNPVEIYSLFLNGEEKFLQHFHHEICSTIIDSFYKNFDKISCELFLSFYQRFFIIINDNGTSIMEDFLSKCKVPEGLHEQQWLLFFEEYYNSSGNHGRQAKNLCNFVERCFSHYQSITDREIFFVSLINEKIANFYKHTTDSSMENTTQFSDLLIKYGRYMPHHLLIRFTDVMELIAQCNNTFQYLVAEAFVQCTLPILRDSKDFKEYMEVLNECITFILEDLSWMSSKTSPQQFICWNIINSSCPDFDLEGFSENLEWLSTVGSSIINRNLCKIYMEHRSPEQLQSAEGKRYYEWILSLQGLLLEWQNKFNERRINYSAILSCASNNKILLILQREGGLPVLQPDFSDISCLSDLYQGKFEIIKSFLVQHPQGSTRKSCLLHELLEMYTVNIPRDIKSFIDEKLSDSMVKRDNVTANWEQYFSLSIGNDDTPLYINEDCTLLDLINVSTSMETFLKPFYEHLKEFVYFSLESSELFDFFIRNQFAKEGKYTLMQLSEGMSADEFAFVIKDAKLNMKKIVQGKAKYSDISSCTGLKTSSLMKKEFSILDNYIKDFGLLDAFKHELLASKDMIQLFHYSSCIASLCEIIKTFDSFATIRKEEDTSILLNISNKINSKVNRNLTARVSQSHYNKIWSILELMEKKPDCLYIFTPILQSKAFFKFLYSQNFIGKKGDERFQEKYGLITAQLQHEKYNETVLNHLLTAYRLMAPFLKPVSLPKLMSEVQNFYEKKAVLKTVIDSLTDIHTWFSKAEEDTLENVAKKLHDIIESGKFCFIHKSEESNSYVQKVSLRLQYQSSSVPLSVHSSDRDTSPVLTSQSWNSEQIKDFVRKLGFLDKDKEQGSFFKQFLKLSQMAYKFLEHLKELNEYGCPLNDTEPILCSISGSEMEAKIHAIKREISDWKCKTSGIYNKYRNLLLLNMPKLLQIYNVIRKIIDDPTTTNEEKIFLEICFLFTNNSSMHTSIKSGLQELTSVKNSELSDPMITVGQFLNSLINYCQIEMCNSSLSSYSLPFYQPLYTCSSLSKREVLCLIIGIFNGIPKPYQVLRCESTTTEHEVMLFWKRSQYFKSEYLILNFNKLPFKIQELLVHLHMTTMQSDMDISATSMVHFIETSTSILHEVPWIELKDFSTKLMKECEAEEICRTVKGSWANVHLIFGEPGNGKSFYIKKQLLQCTEKLTISVNEAFTLFKAVTKLRTLPLHQCDIGIYFNFTIFPLDGSVGDAEKQKMITLMESISWFFFDLLFLGYVEDKATGLSFQIPGELGWKIFIEVPSHFGDVGNQAIERLTNFVPVFLIFDSIHEITVNEEFEINEEAQFVCKYLKAYQNGTIDEVCTKNRLIVKFSRNEPLQRSECHGLFKQYMPEWVLKSKITQKLFIKYMYRRCKFLDECPGFIFNIGKGEVLKKRQFRKDPIYTNTEHLGSILMETMLEEVKVFCNPEVTKKWANPEYQQLIYDFLDGGSSFGLLSLKTHSKSSSALKQFKEIGIKPISLKDINTRKTLDNFLSRALSVKLKDGVLEAIDEKPYVLTLDYTIKMLNIHERRQCGMPVILEGETGVGKTALIEMLSDLWMQSLIINFSKIKSSLIQHIHSELKKINNEEPLLEKLNEKKIDSMNYKFIKEICNYQYGTMHVLYKCIWKFLLLLKNECSLISLEKLKPKLVYQSNNLDSFFDRMCTPDNVANILYAILRGQLQSLFHKINVHGALTPDQIKELLQPAIQQANNLQQINSSSPIYTDPVYITVFLDEINTASCLGLLKEIITDRTIEGKKIPENMFFVAACNPHRGNSLVSHDWMRSTYYVRPLHPTLKYLMWDFDSLSKEQEEYYINAKFSMMKTSPTLNVQNEMTKMIVRSQELMREYAKQPLLDNFGDSTREQKEFIERSSHSCVSQRDIQRVFTIYEWFMKLYREKKYHGDEDYNRRAILVSIGIVYYMRLNSFFRKKYKDNIDSLFYSDHRLNFSKAYEDELQFFIDQVKLPRGTAKTTALKENILATIVCTQTHIPLIIVGEPGSSKTLSFNQTVFNLKGEQSKQIFFRDTTFFTSLNPFFYQCSHHTTSNEIETVFSRAINRQRSHHQFNIKIKCVVFMDEAGLPEESHESLKALHPHLDKKEVSFVAITNHALDAAKTNRAISLFRPKAVESELKTLVVGCLYENSPKSMPVGEVVKFCKPYLECMQKPWFAHLFGLRDFHHFVIYLRRHTFPKHERLIRGLQRNFSGSERFEVIIEEFLAHLKDSEEMKVNQSENILDIFEETINDSPKDLTEFETTPIRYKLVIDKSDDNSLIRIIFSLNSMKKQKVRIFFCSDFSEDSELEIVNTIAAIRHCAGEGHTVIMCQSDSIFASFYDLFNQRFRKYYSEKEGPSSYYCNIAIGPHSKPSRVHKDFQCVIVIKKSEIDQTPAPLLNRFEKYLLSHTDILNSFVSKLPENMRKIIRAAQDKVECFIHNIGGAESLYGYQDETLSSLMINLIPSTDQKYADFSRQDIKIDKSEDPFVFLVLTILNILRQQAGFNIPTYGRQELLLDADSIFNVLSQVEALQELDARDYAHEDIAYGIEKAFELLYNTDYNQDLESDGFLIIQIIEQILIRYVIKKMMQLMTPEGIVLNNEIIPQSYIVNYLKFQTHFSLKDTISNHYLTYKYSVRNNATFPNKLLIYTRSSSLLHNLQANYGITDVFDEKQNDVISSLIFEDPNKLFIQKLSSVSSQNWVQEILESFVKNDEKEILVLIANMQNISIEIINHVRFMCEEADNKDLKKSKLFVLILHFSPDQFFNHCYPALFLREWEHYYLDTVSSLNNKLNLANWLLECFFDADVSESYTAGEVNNILEDLLDNITPILASQIPFSDFTSGSFNSAIKSSDRERALKCILKDYNLGYVIREQFCEYWKPTVVLDYLEKVALNNKKRSSVLNITDSLYAQLKSLFIYFSLYMLSLANENGNLDVLCSSKSLPKIRSLFLDVYKCLPVPELTQLMLLCGNLKPPICSKNSNGFPFFYRIYESIEKSLNWCNKKKISRIMESEANFDSDRIIMFDSLQKVEALAEQFFMVMGDKKNEIMVAVEATADEDIWKVYLRDFISHKLNLWNSTFIDDNNQSEILINNIMQTFCHNLSIDKSKRLIVFHCYSTICSLDMAKLVNILRPLQLTKQLPQGLHSFSDTYKHGEADGIVEIPHPSRLKGADEFMDYLTQNSKYFIEALFDALLSSTYSSNQWSLKDGLKIVQWLKCYRDIISSSKMAEILYKINVSDKEDLRVQFDIMHATYIMCLCLPSLSDDCLFSVVFTVHHLTDKYFDINLKVKKEIPELQQFSSAMFNVLSPQYENNRTIYLKHMRKIVENLTEHWFLHCNLKYDINKVDSFLKVINSYQWWMDSIPLRGSESDSVIKNLNFCRMKYYVFCMLWWHKNCQLQDATHKAFWHLSGCNMVVRNIIGKVILASEVKSSCGYYIPFFDKEYMATKNDIMKQPLVHVYFLVILEQILLRVSTSGSDAVVELIELATNIMERIMDLDSELKEPSEVVLLQVEFQSVKQVLIQQIAFHLDCDMPERFERIRKFVKDIMCICKYGSSDEAHEDLLLFHLHNNLNGIRSLSRNYKFLYGTNLFKSSTFKGLQTIEEFKPKFLSVLHKGKISELFQDLTELMLNIHNDKKEAKDLIKASQYWCRKKDKNAYFSWRMVLWFVSYQQFYMKKITSEKLCEIIDNPKILKEHQCIQLIQCFLDPQRMISVKSITDSGNYSDSMVQTQWSPIYDLFNTKKNKDPSQEDFKCALANLVGVVLGSPPQHQHLWFHLCDIDKLKGTFMTGSMKNEPVSHPSHSYDQSVELTLSGDFGRREYWKHAFTGNYTHHSLYLLLWANFGAFCLSLLTQKDALCHLKGGILSQHLDIHEFCFSQVQFMWKILRDGLKLTNETRSQFFTICMDKLYEMSENTKMTQGLFKSVKEVTEYETQWHIEIYQKARDMAMKEIDHVFSADDKKLSRLRFLEHSYPVFPQQEDLKHYILSNSSLESLKDGGCHYSMARFVINLQKLRVGGELLPELIKLYRWIHTDFSLRVTKREASRISIKKLFDISIKNSDDYTGDLTYKFLHNILANCREYLSMEDCVTESEETLMRKKKFEFRNNTSFLHFLSVTETAGFGKDYLYELIMEIIGDHNDTIKSFHNSVKNINSWIFPDNPIEIHPNEMSSESVIISSQDDIQHFEMLLRSRYMPSFLHKEDSTYCSKFDLDELLVDTAIHFIRNKPLIIENTPFRMMFEFRKESGSENSAELNLTSSTLESRIKRLPRSFKNELTPDVKNQLLYEFHSASFNTLNDIETFLLMVLNLLLEKLKKDGYIPELENMTIALFMMQHYEVNDFQSVMDKLILSFGSQQQQKLLESFTLEVICRIAEFFHDWLEKGFYNFCGIPKYFKISMETSIKSELELCLFKTKTDNKLIKVKKEVENLSSRLKIVHNELLKMPDEVSAPLIDILVSNNIIDKDCIIYELIPRSIKLHHYVDFRIFLTRVIDRMQHEMPENRVQNKWPELVDNLWTKYLTHIREVIFSMTTLEFLQTTDVVVYGFPLQDEKVDTGTEMRKDFEKEIEKPSTINKIFENVQDYRNPNGIAQNTSVDCVCAFLEDINLPEYIDIFKESDFDGSMLFDLDPDTLADIGVSNPLHQVLITQLFDRKMKSAIPKYAFKHISDFLSKNKLEVYSSKIENSGIDGDMILAVSNKKMQLALQELDIPPIAARRICAKFKNFTETLS